MATIDMPLQDRIERRSSPRQEGFNIKEVRYSDKVSQRSFDGPSQSTSRAGTHSVTWVVEYATPAQVLAGVTNELQTLLTFYENAYLERVRWKPFEIQDTRIWEIIPDSLRRSNPAGCISEVTIQFRFLYSE
tara:strand:+ start:8101 stop:8496 length:396 start_codon:yes stop_codon:yes gene_type:complete